MLLNTNLSNGLPIFKAFSSPIRIRIFQLIIEEPGISISAISKKLSIPPSTLATHMQILKDADLINVVDSTAVSHKTCYVPEQTSQIMIDMSFFNKDQPSRYRVSVPVGRYNDFHVTPPCGLASSSRFLGQLDEPRYFSQLTRTQADIIWFTTGYLEYALPNFIPLKSNILSLSLTFEISSEAPEHNNDYPSDIRFSLNGTYLGSYLSPGDYGDRPGKLNPSWWFPMLNQYGISKKLTINSEGTFLDGEFLSDVTIKALDLSIQSPWKFRFSVDPDCEHPGGCTLFGKNFGDHPQDILFEILYTLPD